MDIFLIAVAVTLGLTFLAVVAFGTYCAVKLNQSIRMIEGWQEWQMGSQETLVVPKPEEKPRKIRIFRRDKEPDPAGTFIQQGERWDEELEREDV